MKYLRIPGELGIDGDRVEGQNIRVALKHGVAAMVQFKHFIGVMSAD